MVLDLSTVMWDIREVYRIVLISGEIENAFFTVICKVLEKT